MIRELLGGVALLVVSLSAAVAQQTESGGAVTPAAPSPDDQVASLEAHCARNAEARASRHAEKSLFERLRGEEGIHALTREVVRLHQQNDAIKHLLDGVDAKGLAHGVALFLISNTGGPALYDDGPDLQTSHAHMNLTNADFMAAGSDVIQAMKNLNYGENEIDEMVCAFVGLRDQVVLAEADVEAPTLR